MPAQPPSTSDYVRHHARHFPGSIAVVEDDREIDYATFHRDLGRFTRAVRGFDLPRGSLVAVAWESFYLHWLLLLACENAGYVTASFLPGERRALLPLIARARMVLSGQDVPQATRDKSHRLTPEWLAGVLGSAEAGEDTAPVTALGPDEPQRVRRSSGTTGSLKMMAGTRRVEDLRVERYLWYMGFTPQSRLLLTTPFTVGATFSRATACLRLGATCIGEARLDLTPGIVRHRPTHAWLLPFQVKSVLEELPADFRRPDDFTVMVGTAPLTVPLLQKLKERLASHVIYLYSCNEAGTIASVDTDGVCNVRPGVEAEVVDERGAPVAAGQLGQIKVRSKTLVDGYLDNPEATARAFRDGWFHTGDAGVMLAPGRLKLVGRNDDLLNIGGRKIDPALVEVAVARGVALEDVGVTSIRNPDGVEEICVAIVVKNPAAARERCDEVQRDVAQRFGTAHVKAVDAIPRTEETGKIRRAELRKLFAPG